MTRPSYWTCEGGVLPSDNQKKMKSSLLSGRALNMRWN
ncbi:hypothetical protein SBC1_50090 (plasmid) [Caballeronia sp. SBC1]|nr:hypothetical protein SBC2_37880 [Caballeronia sp. SBC2]QIN64969.1 hypothetical protein SBC1_50090 [Caballeronia sp. SBC1]